MAKWVVDPDHSVAAFAVRHMMVSNVHGQFNRIAGTIQFDPGNVGASSVQVEIETAGIWTGIQKRDEHLRSADFFDVAKYPKMLFESTGVEALGSNRFRLAGNLTIHGVTRLVTFDVGYLGPVKGTEEGETVIGFTATTAINREEYGIMWNVALLEKGGVVVGKEVQITLNVEADPVD